MAADFKIFESELMAIAYEANKYSNRETGGDLFGLWTSSGNPVVFLATGPGPGAKGYSAEYEMDIEHMEKCEDLLLSMFGIQYLGDWHSHHGLGLSRPSHGDQERIKNLSRKNNRTHMCEIIVNHISGGGFKEQISTYVYTNGFLKDSNICVLETSTSPIRKALIGQMIHKYKINLIDGQLPMHSISVSSHRNSGQFSGGGFQMPPTRGNASKSNTDSAVVGISKSNYQISNETIKITLER